MSLLLVGAASCVLLAGTYGRDGGWARLRRRSGPDWLIDGSGLVIQGVVIPLLQTSALYLLLERVAPGWQGRLSVSPGVAFVLNFVVIDYAYYWNHRLLHGAGFWRWHAVHHTAEELDVLVTARNTVWSHFLIVYVWINALGIFLLEDPTAFVLSAALTAALDLWRHSEVSAERDGVVGRLLARALITPAEHAWHHSAARTNCNFGANLSWWDRIHGTYYSPGKAPEHLGVTLGWTPFQKLLFPFRAS